MRLFSTFYTADSCKWTPVSHDENDQWRHRRCIIERFQGHGAGRLDGMRSFLYCPYTALISQWFHFTTQTKQDCKQSSLVRYSTGGMYFEVSIHGVCEMVLRTSRNGFMGQNGGQNKEKPRNKFVSSKNFFYQIYAVLYIYYLFILKKKLPRVSWCTIVQNKRLRKIPAWWNLTFWYYEAFVQCF